MRAVAALVLLSSLTGCAARRPYFEGPLVFRHMNCQADPGASSPSVATCTCNSPQVVLNAATGRNEILCRTKEN